MSNGLPQQVLDQLADDKLDRVEFEMFRAPDGELDCTGRLAYVMKSGSRLFTGERVPVERPEPRGLRVVK